MTTEGGPEVLPWRLRPERDASQFLSPAVRAALAARGATPDALADGQGSGAGGRWTREDVDRVVGATDAVGASRAPQSVRVPFNPIQRRASAALLASTQEVPHAFATARARYDTVERARSAARSAFRAEEGFALTYLPFVARAVVDTLREFPMLNAQTDGESLQVRSRVDLGIAVDLDFQGLVVPTVRGADQLDLRGLARAVYDLATRARARKLTPDDVAPATFTITNPGASRTWMSFPVLNRPAVAILSTDGVSKQVVASTDDADDRLVIAAVGHLCMAFDHRALDDAYVGSFLDRLRTTLETRDWSTEL